MGTFSRFTLCSPLSSPNEKTSFNPIIRFLNLLSLEVWEAVVAGTCCLMREEGGKNLDQTTMTKEIKKEEHRWVHHDFRPKNTKTSSGNVWKINKKSLQLIFVPLSSSPSPFWESPPSLS